MKQHINATAQGPQRARWRGRAAFAATAASAAVLLLPAAPAFAATTDHWSPRATEIAPPKGAASDPQAQMNGLACTSKGFCVTGGQYNQASGHTQAMVATQARGRWARMQALTLPRNAAADPNGDVLGMACASRGNCVAVGSYNTAPSTALPMAAAESRGRWAAGAALRLPANAESAGQQAYLSGVSCTSAGACEAVGGYLDKSSATQMMAAYKPARGRWGRLKEIKAPKGAAANPSAAPNSIACTNAKNCVAVGSYYTPKQIESMAVVEVRGRWRRAKPVAAPANAASILASVSCMHRGTCVAVGLYQGPAGDASMALTVTRGRFGKTAQITAMPRHSPAGGLLQLEGVSCAPAGPCVAAGSIYVPGSSSSTLVTVLRAPNGRWKQAALVAPPRGIDNALFNAIACGSGGHCTATGYGMAPGVKVALAASTR